MFSAVDSLVQYVNQEPIILMLRTGVRLSNVPISGMDYLQHLGLDGELHGGEFTWPNGTRLYIPEVQTCVPSPYIFLTKTPHLPVMHSV